jgi:hypothetical protein
MRIRPYEELFNDQNANVMDRINSIIDYLNQVGKLTNDVVKDWNTVYNWVMNDGLTTDVNNKIEAMNASGELNTILSSLFNSEIGDLTTLITPQKDKVVNAINSLKSLVDANTVSLAQKAAQDDLTDMQVGGRNLLNTYEFEVSPNNSIRSTVYSLIPNNTEQQYQDRKSLKIITTGYETSQDVNKDFAFLLNENINQNDKITVSFWAYPLVNNQNINIRMAYSSGNTVNLGTANQWNFVSFQLTTSDITTANTYLYFNFNASFTVYFSSFKVERGNGTVYNPTNLNDIYKKLGRNPENIHNTSGAVSRLVDVAQSYYNNIGNLVYGNSFTAYDTTIQQVNGKYQIDCSSFVNLMLQGVTYENSRYNGNSQNIGSALFHPAIDSYKYRYANQIAQYAYENGYAFKANADLSNVEPGDILFFNWGTNSDGFHNNAFMNIDHVGVVLHKKNDSIWTLLEFDNNITTVYYDANIDTYMSKTVLVARFPYQDIEPVYPEENLIIGGDIPHNVTNTTSVYTYNLSAPLVQGRYYTMVLSGNVVTPSCYFVVQVNISGTYYTIYSDFGRSSSYTGAISFRFPYNIAGQTNQIIIGIGAPSGTDSNRAANVNWVSLYEGYAKGKNYFNKPLRSTYIYDFPLNASLVSDLNSGMAPYYKYGIDGNKVIINFSLPFNTLRTGTLSLGSIGANIVTNTQRIPCSLVGSTNQAINAILQVSSGGEVSIIPYDATVQWKNALANGVLFKD